MPKSFLLCLGILVAGGVGSLARFGFVQFVGQYVPNFPLGTLLVNVVGAFILGVINTRLTGAAGGNVDMARLILGVGLMGGLTTFSSMMYESDKMITDAAYLRTAAYLAASLFLGLVAVRLGVLAAKTM